MRCLLDPASGTGFLHGRLDSVQVIRCRHNGEEQNESARQDHQPGNPITLTGRSREHPSSPPQPEAQESQSSPEQIEQKLHCYL